MSTPEAPFSEQVVVAPAYRNGSLIGDGLFATRDFHDGEQIVTFVDGSYMRLHLWESHCATHNLPSDWAGFLGMKCLPPPTKRVARVMIYDASWVSPATRPLWTYINHGPTTRLSRAANCRPRIPSRSSDCHIVFYATRDIPAGSEIMFDYGGNTSDFS